MKKVSIKQMIDRIIQITARLEAGEKINIKEEASRFDVSERTIKRDLEKISKHIYIESKFLKTNNEENKKNFFFKF